MAGDFNDAIRPILPGAYTRYTAQSADNTPPAPGSIVALPITHDWGPMDVAQLVTDYGDFQTKYGVGGVVTDTPGARAVYDAFRGEGVSGIGGAGGIYLTRFGGAAAAKTTVTLKNPAAANALLVNSKYETGRATLKLVISPTVGGLQTVDLYDGTTRLESFTFTVAAGAALAGLRDAINATSVVLQIPTDNTGVILEGTTGLAAGTFTLTGGNDGSVLAAGDWSGVWDTFADVDFAFLAPFNIQWSDTVSEPWTTNRAITAGLVQWVRDENARGHRVQTVIGVALNSTTATSLACAAAAASEFVVVLGGQGVNDDLWGDWSTAQLAPRVAGILAQRGETQAAHFARLSGTLPRPKPGGGATSIADAEQLTLGGCIAIMRDRYQLAPTRLVKSVNSYTGDTSAKPRVIYGNPKFVLSMQQFANEVESDAEVNLIGRVVITQKVRDAIAARALRIAKEREPLAFAPGTVVLALPGEDTDEFVQLSVQITFGRALAQLFIQANVR